MRTFGCATSVRERSVVEGLEEAVEALEKVIEKEKFNHVRIAALDSLGQIGGERIAGIVGGLVRDDDPDVAHAAQMAFEKGHRYRLDRVTAILQVDVSQSM